jgi:hypothetical protein
MIGSAVLRHEAALTGDHGTAQTICPRPFVAAERVVPDFGPDIRRPQDYCNARNRHEDHPPEHPHRAPAH